MHIVATRHCSRCPSNDDPILMEVVSFGDSGRGGGHGDMFNSLTARVSIPTTLTLDLTSEQQFLELVEGISTKIQAGQCSWNRVSIQGYY